MRHLLPLAAVLTLMLVGCETTARKQPHHRPELIHTQSHLRLRLRGRATSVLCQRCRARSAGDRRPDKTENATRSSVRSSGRDPAGRPVAGAWVAAVRWRGTAAERRLYVIRGSSSPSAATACRPEDRRVCAGAASCACSQAYRVDGKQRKLLGEVASAATARAWPANTGREALRHPRGRVSRDRCRRGALGNHKVKKGAEDTAADHRAAQSEDAGVGWF
jgi:hypothetical protein